MIVAEGQIDHGADGAGIVNDYRSFLNRADAQNRHVRLIDDGQAHQAAEGTWVGDGKGALLDVLRFELFRERAFGQITNSPLQSQKVFFLGMLDYGNDQSPIKSHGNADVDLAVKHYVCAVHGSVDRGEVAQGVRAGAHKERHEGELHLVLLL